MNILEKCSYCGVENCIAHKKYTDRCVDCGKRYHKYTSYKSQQKSKYSFKREHLLDEIRYDYQQLKRAGYRVPKDIE